MSAECSVKMRHCLTRRLRASAKHLRRSASAIAGPARSQGPLASDRRSFERVEHDARIIAVAPAEPVAMALLTAESVCLDDGTGMASEATPARAPMR